MDENISTALNRKCVDCLIVKKVYDACSRRECLENIPFDLELPGGRLADYTFCYTTFGRAVVLPYDDEPFFTERDELYARLRMVVGIPVYAVLRRKSDGAMITAAAHPIHDCVVQHDNLVRIPVDTTVYAPRTFLRQGRFEPYAESFVETGCSIAGSGASLSLTLGIFLIIKVVSDVQLKIPNFGFCDAPPECDEPCDEDFCSSFLDEEVTPFPQFFPSDIG